MEAALRPYLHRFDIWSLVVGVTLWSAGITGLFVFAELGAKGASEVYPFFVAFSFGLVAVSVLGLAVSIMAFRRREGAFAIRLGGIFLNAIFSFFLAFVFFLGAWGNV